MTRRNGVLPTKREILAELGKEIEAWRSSNRERDGEIHDPNVLHTIRCLELARQIVKEWKAPVTQRRGQG